VLIRRATLQDLEVLVRLGKQTFSEAFAADNDPADMAQYLDTAFSPSTLRQQLASPDSVFLLLQTSAAAGQAESIGYARLIERSPIPNDETDNAIELSRLYVLQRELGKGYGSGLMQACLEYAAKHGFDTIWLGVWEQNVRAQQFYQRWGFRKIGTQAFVLGKDIQNDDVLRRSVTPL
jgi:ribosomal protein S18 acetylase RimI-like enzyme